MQRSEAEYSNSGKRKNKGKKVLDKGSNRNYNGSKKKVEFRGNPTGRKWRRNFGAPVISGLHSQPPSTQNVLTKGCQMNVKRRFLLERSLFAFLHSSEHLHNPNFQSHQTSPHSKYPARSQKQLHTGPLPDMVLREPSVFGCSGGWHHEETNISIARIDTVS